MFHTITARYPGTCQRCGGAIKAGETIRYGGRRRTYHLRAECDRRAEARADRGEDFHLDDDSRDAVAMRYGESFAAGLGR